MAILFMVPGGTIITISGSQLGYVEDEFPVELIGYHEDIHTDYSGPQMPADVQYFGEGAVMAFTLIKYDESVLNRLKARLNGGTPGAGAAGSIGTLLVAEQKFFTLSFVSAYGSFFPAMNSAFNFAQVYPADSFAWGQSTRVKRERVVLRAIPVINTDGSYTLYTLG